jgi:hypothetical protein
VAVVGALGSASDARENDRRDDVELSYWTVQPNRWTFQSDKIRRWVERRLRGRTLNACAGKTKLTHDHKLVRNDIDEDRDADLHVDVCEVADYFEPGSFGTIVYDPPFSQNQSNESYDGQMVGSDALAKRQFDQLLRPGGRVIQFGFSTTCMPVELERDGGRTVRYDRREVGVWNTLGRSNDYLSVVDEKEGEADFSPRWFGGNSRAETADTDRCD